MTRNFTEKALSKYEFRFPTKLIAQSPALPRDSARLMVYRRNGQRVFYDTFKNIGRYVPTNAVFVFNETKVIPARFAVHKETGGKAELLYIGSRSGLIQVLANRKLSIGARLRVARSANFIVKKSDGRFYYLKSSFPVRNIIQFLNKYGVAPLPPYIKHPAHRGKKLIEEYQTIFAKKEGSIAAPTASLHFTKRLLAELKKKGCDIQFITLHVGLGTFAPVTNEQLHEGTLHSEHYEISKKTARELSAARAQGKPIIAVGTTVVRALESAADARGALRKLEGETTLFIQEGYKFKYVNGIVTNFHVPRSSLLMLISAFCPRREVLSLYKKAIQKKFRLFSFGDGMLIL